MRTLDLFSGIGGLALGLERVGFIPAAFCEQSVFCRTVLSKHWPEVPQYDDVCTVSGDRLRADGVSVDAICGGFPCQDISYAGDGAGLEGARSGLWSEMDRLVRELRPRLVIVENVAALLGRGMGTVLGDLSRAGYDAEWATVSACSVGLPHVRRRVFVVAYPDGEHGRPRVRDTAPRSHGTLQALHGLAGSRARQGARLAHPSALYGGADGVPFGMERNRAIGNAVAPDVAEAIGTFALASLSKQGRDAAPTMFDGEAA